MKNFDVYFEIFGKKMKTRILAENQEKAKEEVKNKIVFHKVEKSNEEFNQCMDILEELSNIIGGKKRS
jgi:hypothetical protein